VRQLATFRETYLPAKPDAELCFAIYRLIMPEARGRCRRAAAARRRAAALAPNPTFHSFVVPTLVAATPRRRD
jgi:hypothetical protein